jgi:hypothetical protein
LIAPLAALAPRGSRFLAVYFVVAPGRGACPVSPPQHVGARSGLIAPLAQRGSLAVIALDPAKFVIA